MEEKRQTTTNYRLYELDRAYKDKTNFINYINEAQNFYNGKQYPNENYKNMIRITINICSMSAQLKASKICGTPIYLTFTADDNETDCNALRQFDEYNCSKIGLDVSNYQSALNGYANGTEITFMPWDEDNTTYKGIYKGGLSEEHIDLLKFAVANPHIQDIQKQKWVMYWDDCEVGAIKDMLEGSKKDIEYKKQLINREIGISEEEYDEDRETINHSLCRLYTRFFRVKGEVYFMCSTETVDIFVNPHPISKKVSKKIIEKVVDDYKKQLQEQNENQNENQDKVLDYKIDWEDVIINSISRDAFENKEYEDEKEKFNLYPFAVFRPFMQNRSFYGRSDIKQLIPIQKGINFAISMVLKCAENNAYNKIFAKADALQGQEITNEPSQVIIDYSNQTNSWGIKMAESQPLPNQLLAFANDLLSMTRVVYGFNNVMDGSVTNQDLSGYAVQQMIRQSDSAIEQQQKLFWQYNVDKAQIRLLYYKHYVDKAKYTYELNEIEYDGEEQARNRLYKEALEHQKNGTKFLTMPNAVPEDFEKPTHKTKIEEITNNDIWGKNFDISIEAMQGLADSKLIEAQMWDNLFMNGGLQNIDPEILDTYIQSCPNVSPRTKISLKHAIENRKQSEIAKLQGELAELTQQSGELAKYTKILEAKLGYQKSYIDNITKEFTDKINASNKISQALFNDLAKMKSEGQKKSENATSKEQMASMPTK